MSNQEMSVEERNLISVAYKNAVGSRRASWRIISSVEQKEASKGNEQNVEMAKAYRIRVEAELNKICGEILELIAFLRRVIAEVVVALAQLGAKVSQLRGLGVLRGFEPPEAPLWLSNTDLEAS